MRWSYSRLSMYRQCPAKVRYRYVENIPTPPSGPAAQRGVDTHAHVEAYIKGEMATLPSELEHYTTLLDNIKKAGGHAELKVAVDKFWQKTDWENGWLVGILDSAVFQPKLLHVYDWKTGKLYDDHEKQADLYAPLAASLSETYEEITIHFVYLDQGKTKTWTYDQSKVETIRSGLANEIARADADTDMIPMPSMACRWCPYSKQKGGPCPF